jgi:hypothetical protein
MHIKQLKFANLKIEINISVVICGKKMSKEKKT